MPHSRYAIGCLLSFLAVTAALQWWQAPSYPSWTWLFLGFFGLLGFLGCAPHRALLWCRGLLWRRGYTGWGVLLLCVVAGAALAFLRVAHTTHVATPESIETFALGGQVTLYGIIADEPDRRPLQTKYTVEVTSLDTHLDDLGATRDDTKMVLGKVLVTDYAAWPRHAYGDEVHVSGVLEKPGMIEDFPYDRYLSRYGITAIMPHASVETGSSGRGSRFFTVLFHLKERFERKIARLFPEPHASFLAGLLTGSRRGIPKTLLSDFKATGLTHIIAISGYNITIVVSVIVSLLFFLPLRWRLVPSLLAILFFTLFVGASPSVVRAAIMGGLGLLALHVGREKHALIAILLAASLMVAWNPKLLWYDAGFQLSFLSVLGLTYLSPFLERPSHIVPDLFGMRDAFKMTLAAQLVAVPLVIVLFGTLSLVAPLANVLSAFLVPLAMLLGFLSTALTFFPASLGLPAEALAKAGQLVAYPAWGALELIIRIARALSDLPYTFLVVPRLSVWFVGGYYVILLSMVWLLSVRRNVSRSSPACYHW